MNLSITIFAVLTMSTGVWVAMSPHNTSYDLEFKEFIFSISAMVLSLLCIIKETLTWY